MKALLLSVRTITMTISITATSRTALTTILGSIVSVDECVNGWVSHRVR